MVCVLEGIRFVVVTHHMYLILYIYIYIYLYFYIYKYIPAVASLGRVGKIVSQATHSAKTTLVSKTKSGTFKNGIEFSMSLHDIVDGSEIRRSPPGMYRTL